MKSNLIRIKQDVYEDLMKRAGNDVNEKLALLLKPQETHLTNVQQNPSPEPNKEIKELKEAILWLKLQNNARVRDLEGINEGLNKIVSLNRLKTS